MNNIAIVMGKISQVINKKELDNGKRAVNFDLTLKDGARLSCSYIGETVDGIAVGAVLLADCVIRNVQYVNASGEQKNFISYSVRNFDLLKSGQSQEKSYEV